MCGNVLYSSKWHHDVHKDFAFASFFHSVGAEAFCLLLCYALWKLVVVVVVVVFNPWANLGRNQSQSGDRYGSGTLHPGQVLKGSLPLLSPLWKVI
jgi:hypothetical protein